MRLEPIYESAVVLMLVRVRGARLTDDRLPEGADKERILTAIDRSTKVVPRWLALAAVALNETRWRRWKQRAALCTLDDRSPCSKQQPSRLTFAEEQTMRDLVESHEHRHSHRLDTFATVEKLVAFYIEQHNTVLPQWVLKWRTPDEVVRGEAIDLAERLREAHRVAIQDRIEANRRLSCVSCQVATRAKDDNQESGEIARKHE